MNFAIQKGLDATRSKIVYYKHNDMKDLEEQLVKHQQFEKAYPKKAAKMKKFIVAEGIYMNTGEICPLPELVALRKRFMCRLLLDESISFGTLGKTGRGLTEHFDVDMIEVDLITGSLEGTLGAIGGFCVGSTYIIEHQRLSGLGYCFSASTPPLLTQAALSALSVFKTKPEIFDEIQQTSIKVHEKFNELSSFIIGGHELSPIKHLYLKDEQEWDMEREILRKICDICMTDKLGVVSASYLDNSERICSRPSLRIAVNRLLTNSDIDFAFDVLNKASTAVITTTTTDVE